HGAGTGLRSLADLHGGDQHRVDAQEGVAPDARPVLGAAVPVRRDRAGPDVGALADLGIADVAHVVLLDPRAEAAVLELRVIADLGPRPDARAGAKVAVRSDADIVLDDRALDHAPGDHA